MTMGDELRMPTWAAAWHVNEAKTHGVDGAVALSDADPFVLRALERAGRPDEARAAYEKGLEAAARNGDLQTKKEIEVFLRRLGST